MFHPRFYNNFPMFWSCRGEFWRRLYLPQEEMFSAVVLPGLTRGDPCPKDCVQTTKTVALHQFLPSKCQVIFQQWQREAQDS